jgi:hypothetical protein
MSHLDTIARAAYTAWVARCGTASADFEWEKITQEKRNAWIAIVFAVLDSARTTGTI